ncbi:MAG TPA: CopD family protein [Dehalococcoidia bacterium]
MAAAGIAVLLGVAVAWAAPATVDAHAVLVRSEPAQNARLKSPPLRIDLFFSEALDHASSTIHVVDAMGAHREAGSPRFTADATEMQVAVGPLASGYYTVAWTTVSAVDGHRLLGSYPFVVLNPDGTLPAGAPAGQGTAQAGGGAVQLFDIVLRWLLLLGLIGVAGGFGFAALVTLPAAQRLHGAPRLAAERQALSLVGRGVPVAAALTATVSLVAWLRAVAENGSLTTLSDVFSGRDGVLSLVRELLVLAILALATAAGHRVWVRGKRMAVLLLAGLGCAGGALLTVSLASHAAAGTGAGWAVPADFLHLCAAALWLGCLVQLPLVLIRGARPSASGTREMGVAAREPDFRAVVLQRFSALALVCVAVILFTGAFNALVQLPSWSAVTETGYGRVLLVKLALVAVLLGLGALNALRLGRRLERASGAGSGEAAEARRLARGAAIESVAGAAVIAATAVLVSLAPARDVAARTLAAKAAVSQPAGQPYQQTVSSADLHAMLTVTPNQPGENSFTVQLSGPDADHALRVQLRFGGRLGGSAVTLAPREGATGTYTAAAANLAQPGRWPLTVNVQRAGHDDVSLAFSDDVTVPGRAGAGGLWRFPAHGITPLQLIAAAIALVAFLPFLARFIVGRFPLPRLGRAGLAVLGTAAVAVVLVAAVTGGSGQATSGAAVPSTVTTVTPAHLGQVTAWQIPTPASGLMTPAVGPDGRIWIAEMNTNKLATLDPASGRISEYTFNPNRVLSVMGVVVDGHGRVWMAEGSVAALGMLDPASGAYTEYRTPTAGSSPSGLALDSEGRVWLTEINAGKLAVFDPDTEAFTEYTIPGPGVVPYWLTVAPNGDVWFTDIAHGQIGVLHLSTGGIELFPIAGVSGTTGIVAAADGTIWFGGKENGLGQFTPATRATHLIPLPPGAAYGVSIGHDGTVWIGTTGDTVYGVDPATGRVQSVTAGDGAWWPVTGADGSVWVAAGADAANALDRVTTTQPAAQQP